MLFLGQLLFFVVEVPIIALVVLCLLFYYSAKRGATSWYVYLLVGIAWFICLVVIFLVPLDLAETLVDRCQVLVSYSEYTGYQKGDCPIHETRPGFVFILWLVIYWISFALTWLFLPIFSQYAVAGDYSIGKRLQTALWSNALFYAICGVFIIGFGIYMGIRYHLSAYSLMGLLIGLSNAFGLLGVICMLGYGIVQIPRALWHRGDLSRRLRYCEFKVTEYTDRMDEARADLAQILGQIERVQQKLAHLLSATDNEGTNVEEAGISQSSFPKRHRLINFIQVIISEIPKEDLRVALPVPDRTAEIPKTITENFLAFLHQRLNQRVIEYRKSSYLWGRTCDEAFQLEQWMTWKSCKSWKNVWIPNSHSWYAFYIPLICRLFAFMCIVLSILFLWSETTIWSLKTSSHVDLSPLSLWIHRQGMSNYSIQLISLFSIAYLALCVYYSLFHFNLYRFYELIPQHTDAYSLFLNALLCCRFTVPLCYNFLTLLHETSFAVPLLYPQIPASLLPTTSFSKVEQSMQVLPILGNSFNAFFPVVLLLFVLGTSFQLWTRFLSSLGLKQFGFEHDDDIQYERLGKELLERERQRRQRLG
ncbi:uncharacterized protein Gasu_40870 [Galdieria sulphuraria]|uniref:LMBR1-like membrane protein n=1 Tax=Galdieria sulphuraria TaxID=130081 RepID=M2VYM8_GALSU|nr:uncharacterized protein Gasu_40870 [Galdieria sulphuraria]EME28391.1 hypothetical protein Gasu_40870 [Galdieria sulphuraria]|eukprot:XP_005704911.1 hypothetical protein Gasu_40870 [Galdieria sulphuraria]